MRSAIKFFFCVLSPQLTDFFAYVAGVDSSHDFEEFLEFLGTKVQLSGWTKFRGGLDTRGENLTGTHSYYTQFQGNEIMYHVVTMMPWTKVSSSRNLFDI